MIKLQILKNIIVMILYVNLQEQDIVLKILVTIADYMVVGVVTILKGV
jgi:hypothetical protein